MGKLCVLFFLFSFLVIPGLAQEQHGGTPGIKLEEPPKEMEGELQFPSTPSSDRLVTNISVYLGEAALLPCRVIDNEHAEVLWVRLRDFHILSLGEVMYTPDMRFEIQIGHSNNNKDWDMQIKPVQKRDNGPYECKVATSSGTISHYYNLHVVVPVMLILDSGDYHIGSTISVFCILENSPTPTQEVFWYHNDKMINYDTARGGVTVSTEPGPRILSRLTVNNASYSDSGNYTCGAKNTEPVTVQVFVTKAEESTKFTPMHDAAVTDSNITTQNAAVTQSNITTQNAAVTQSNITTQNAAVTQSKTTTQNAAVTHNTTTQNAAVTHNTISLLVLLVTAATLAL